MRIVLAVLAAMPLLLAAIAAPLSADEIPASERRSGFSFMTPETQGMQNDDTSNPGMLWAKDAEALWSSSANAAEKSCADCHGDVGATMRGVVAHYPDFDPVEARPVSLEQRVNLCRTRHQQAEPFAYESRELLALTALIGRQSRGLPIKPNADSQLARFLAEGRALFMQRQGQLNLACASCHDDNWDKHLAGSPITQAHPTGYPEYRLEWQTLGSLERRLRSCIAGIRAQPYDYGSPELVELELYLMSRAAGMPVETPAVRP
jgi:L-cysteine S-thiosulfotransferase